MNGVNCREISRYATVTIMSHLALIVCTSVLVEHYGMEPIRAYVGALGVIYIAVYISSSWFVFRVHLTISGAAWFLLTMAIFMFLNSILFAALYKGLGAPYFVAMVANVAVFGPARYIVNKLLWAS